MERGGKRLVICCDGTWNEPDQEVHDNPADETEPTNVLKIVRGLAPVDGGQVPQVVYYDTGVGTQGHGRRAGRPNADSGTTYAQEGVVPQHAAWRQRVACGYENKAIRVNTTNIVPNSQAINSRLNRRSISFFMTNGFIRCASGKR